MLSRVWIFRTARIIRDSGLDWESRREMANQFAEYFHEQNPRFNYQRFMEAAEADSQSRPHMLDLLNGHCEEFATFTDAIGQKSA